jgi:hypothetical protein
MPPGTSPALGTALRPGTGMHETSAASAGRRIATAGVVAPGLLWWMLAIVQAGPRPQILAYGLAATYGLGCAALIWLAPAARLRRAAIALALLAPLLWWQSIAPSNERPWPPEVSRLPWAQLDANLLIVHGVRNFVYRSETDFDAHWEDRGYDLEKLRGLDVFLSYWGSPAIAHMILSWDFADQTPLAVSIETRRSRGEAYSTLAGFFKQYELIYVAADERDLIQLRTHHRKESVYLYRTRVPITRARALLLDYVTAMNDLQNAPRFYNALTQNCTTTIVTHTRHVQHAAVQLDWRMFLNGYSDSLLYERGLVDTSVPFAELRERSRINERAERAFSTSDFSAAIRAGLPDPSH